MPQIVIGLAVVVILAIAWMLFSRIHRSGSVVVTEHTVDWENAKKVEDLITVYLDIMLEHGPDSKEAQAFRFTMEHQELWKGNKSLDAFNSMIKICDSAVRKYRKANGLK